MADSAETAPDPATPPTTPSILDRPLVERCREFKYRFAQSAVFGAPVLALESFGQALGGAESDLWVSLFQALLAGWVVYVAAVGMLSEGVLLMLAGRRMPKLLLTDFAMAAVAALSYLVGLACLLGLLTGHALDGPRRPHPFSSAVILLSLWTGVRWWHLSKKNSAG
jgi:hypothetical protein